MRTRTFGWRGWVTSRMIARALMNDQQVKDIALVAKSPDSLGHPTSRLAVRQSTCKKSEEQTSSKERGLSPRPGHNRLRSESGRLSARLCENPKLYVRCEELYMISRELTVEKKTRRVDQVLAPCPCCDVLLVLPTRSREGSPVECLGCGAWLEVVSLKPPELDYSLDYWRDKEHRSIR
jgi:hypothetical protein